jgi:hypothetical protein
MHLAMSAPSICSLDDVSRCYAEQSFRSSQKESRTVSSADSAGRFSCNPVQWSNYGRSKTDDMRRDPANDSYGFLLCNHERRTRGGMKTVFRHYERAGTEAAIEVERH